MASGNPYRCEGLGMLDSTHVYKANAGNLIQSDSEQKQCYKMQEREKHNSKADQSTE